MTDLFGPLIDAHSWMTHTKTRRHLIPGLQRLKNAERVTYRHHVCRFSALNGNNNTVARVCVSSHAQRVYQKVLRNQGSHSGAKNPPTGLPARCVYVLLASSTKGTLKTFIGLCAESICRGAPTNQTITAASDWRGIWIPRGCSGGGALSVAQWRLTPPHLEGIQNGVLSKVSLRSDPSCVGRTAMPSKVTELPEYGRTHQRQKRRNYPDGSNANGANVPA